MTCPLPPEELEALLELRLLPHLGDVRLRQLLRRHGSPRAVLALPDSELGEASAAGRGGSKVRDRVRLAVRVIERLDVDVYVIDQRGYPPGLLELHDPPCLLCARGRRELLARRTVAVVGSRRHTEYGAGAAEAIARDLSRAGVVIVSGLARGIDGVAHEAALAGGTIAVLGCGIDVAYPPEHERLFERICVEGLALSEFCPGEPPLAFHFPQRNRIIAALARAVVVIEATGDSGSLITVDHAIDLGRDVLAVPGPIGRDTSVGSNALIQDGAALVMSADDVLAVLEDRPGRPTEGSRPEPKVAPSPPPEERPADADAGAAEPRRKLPRNAGRRSGAAEGRGAAERPAPAGLDPTALALFEALSAAPRHVDELAVSAHLSSARALAELLGLELLGRARQLPGARFVRA